MSVGDYRKGIDLLVVNYRTPYLLGHFLESYQKHKPSIPHSLSIGNVDPLDEDRVVVEKSKKVFAEWDANIGYARAVNYLTTLGDCEVIGIFNADTRLTENTVQSCYNALISNETWGVLGPRQIDDRGFITHGGFFGTNRYPQERGFHHCNSEAYGDIRDDATTVSGSAYFIKRKVWDDLTDCPVFANRYPNVQGAFLPTWHYYEETWCSYHAREHGWKCVYYGAATMIHKWHAASPRGSWVDRQVGVSREKFRDMCDLHGIEHA